MESSVSCSIILEEDMIYRGYLIKAFKNAYGVYAADNSKNFCIRNSESECMDFVDQMKREQRAASYLFGGLK